MLTKLPNLVFTYIILGVLVIKSAQSIELTAHFSNEGIHGKVLLYQDAEPGARPIHLTVDLKNWNQFDGNQTWTWFVTEFPVDYSTFKDRCDPKNIGGLVSDLGDLFGPITFTSNESVYFEFESSTDDFALVGPNGVWGRSMVLVGPSQEKACATIFVSRDNEEWVAEAKFQNGLAGSVFFRWVGSLRNNVTDNAIFSNLMHTSNNSASKHLWKIYVTDILDSEADKSRATCDFLQILFNPDNSEQVVGDLSSRLGPIPVGQVRSRSSSSSKSFFRDTGLSLLPADLLGGRRSLYLVLFDDKHPDAFLACAKIRTHKPTVLKGVIQYGGVTGVVTLSQRTQFNPTLLEFNLTQLGEHAIISAGWRIHQLPPDPNYGAASNRCITAGPVFNPYGVESADYGSQDKFAIGEINKKHGSQSFIGQKMKKLDAYLPLYGPYSVAHRSIVFHRYIDNPTAVPWICATLQRYQSINSMIATPMNTAIALYRYPIVGTVLFRQPLDQPWMDTTVIIEMLIHADGLSVNDTMDHRWSINEFPPGRDFYNWSRRCVSAGEVMNPYKTSYDDQHGVDLCNEFRLSTCRVGDLTGKHGHLNIAGSISNAKLSRRILTDSYLPMTGQGSIIGKSLVIFDDHGPVARGDRLACSKIERDYRRKAVVRSWFSNGKPATVTGKLEFLQQSKYDITNVDVSVEGLVDTKGYHIHMVPVKEDLQFPCEDSTLYGRFNPIGVNSHLVPMIGTPDEYETGDLSGKFGSFENKTTVVSSYNDTSVTLFGYQSIVGRSVVIHKKDKNRRWVCSSIERGYAPSEARELRGIASFHHPGGFAYGYIRMTQLVYKDNSKSETILEVNLRYPGKNDRNLTKNHNWAIYVNSVSVDASVKILNTRCTAGGYIWNPYYTQLADPLNDELYRKECGPDNPLRCYVGDVSGRLGTIDIGDKRQVFTDSNFPLEGDVSAMGRSIVILTPEKGGDRMACANIAPDNDIIKYANVRSSSSFVADLFLQEFREIMGIPEWYLTIDNSKTKYLYGGSCVQFLLHFKGPDAAKLEQDFSHLLNVGNLAQPSIYIPGHFASSSRKTKTSYKLCGNEDPVESFEKMNKKKNYYFTSSASSTVLYESLLPKPIVMESQVVTEIPSSLKQLARLVVRAYYSVEDALIIDMLVRNPCMKEDDLCELLKFEKKMLRAKISTLKADKFLQVRLRMETGADGKAQKVNYYFINYKTFVNVVKYKLDMMRKRMETEERDATSRASFKCPNCLKTFTDLEADQLFDFMAQEFLCTYCKQPVEEDQSAIPKKDSRMQLAKFNEQIEPLFVLLRQVEGIKLAPELLEPEPVDISTIRGIDKKLGGPLRPAGEPWSGESTRHGGFRVEEAHVDVTIGQDTAPSTVVKKDRPVWMAQSTIISQDPMENKDTGVVPAISAQEKPTSKSGEDIMSVLLQHEKRDAGSAEAAVKSLASRRDSDSNSSDEEVKQEPPSQEIEIISSEDEDSAPTVMVGGKSIPVTLVDNTIISKMSAAEKEAYIQTYQEYYSNLYD